ncbi:unnamed protein product [Closterium sp. Yama58-4]|nr:unnamed protein product [Closterium sp. Yama58-4]
MGERKAASAELSWHGAVCAGIEEGRWKLRIGCITANLLSSIALAALRRGAIIRGHAALLAAAERAEVPSQQVHTGAALRRSHRPIRRRRTAALGLGEGVAAGGAAAVVALLGAALVAAALGIGRAALVPAALLPRLAALRAAARQPRGGSSRGVHLRTARAAAQGRAGDGAAEGLGGEVAAGLPAAAPAAARAARRPAALVARLLPIDVQQRAAVNSRSRGSRGDGRIAAALRLEAPLAALVGPAALEARLAARGTAAVAVQRAALTPAAALRPLGAAIAFRAAALTNLAALQPGHVLLGPLSQHAHGPTQHGDSKLLGVAGDVDGGLAAEGLSRAALAVATAHGALLAARLAVLAALAALGAARLLGGALPVRAARVALHAALAPAALVARQSASRGRSRAAVPLQLHWRPSIIEALDGAQQRLQRRVAARVVPARAFLHWTALSVAAALEAGLAARGPAALGAFRAALVQRNPILVLAALKALSAAPLPAALVARLAAVGVQPRAALPGLAVVAHAALREDLGVAARAAAAGGLQSRGRLAHGAALAVAAALRAGRAARLPAAHGALLAALAVAAALGALLAARLAVVAARRALRAAAVERVLASIPAAHGAPLAARSAAATQTRRRAVRRHSRAARAQQADDFRRPGFPGFRGSREERVEERGAGGEHLGAALRLELSLAALPVAAGEAGLAALAVATRGADGAALAAAALCALVAALALAAALPARAARLAVAAARALRAAVGAATLARAALRVEFGRPAALVGVRAAFSAAAAALLVATAFAEDGGVELERRAARHAELLTA